jgi:hypothetical protein
MARSRFVWHVFAGFCALVAAGEESTEFGGYFVCNGIERLLRLLVQPRRHAIVGLKRGAYAKRGPGFTDTAVALRCVRPDETSAVQRADGSWDLLVADAVGVLGSRHGVNIVSTDGPPCVRLLFEIANLTL